jgi:hypothetical protein
MSQQPKYKSLAESDFFVDGSAARLPVEGTIARGYLRLDTSFFAGKVNGVLIRDLPLKVTRQVLERGKGRYGIFCTPCHGSIGDGSGMVVQRGLRRPPSYHIDRLREAPDGHFFDVITSGFGAMPSYASRIPVEDRWAITAYVRALQLSQAAKISDVPPEERPKLLEATR